MPTWMLALGMLALFVVFSVGTWWALWSDRGRGKRRCPSCWYDMRHTPGLVCAECGRPARHERDLLRTRRRPLLAVVSILGLTLVGMQGVEHVADRGWTSFVPTTVLVTFFDAGGPDFTGVERELRRRSTTLTADHWDRILAASADGRVGYRPGEPRWVSEYGGWVSSAYDALVRLGTPAQVARANDTMFDLALRHPPSVTLEAPDIWPAGRPVPVGVIVSDEFSGHLPTRIVASPEVAGAGRSAWARTGRPIQRRSFTVHLPPLEAGSHVVPIAFDFARAASTNAPWVPSVQRTVEAQVQIDPAPDRDLEPVTSERMDRLIQRVFDAELVQWDNGSLPVRVPVNRAATADPDFADTAVGIEVEIRRNGKLGRTLLLWWAGDTPRDGARAWEVPFVDDSVLLPPSRPDDKWTLEIRSRYDLALRVSGVRKWWAGQSSRITTVVPRSGSAPSRGWIPTDVPAPYRANPTQSPSDARSPES